AAVGVQIGDSVIASEREMEQRLGQVPGVVAADVSVVCCEAGRSILYVGIQETNAPSLSFRAAPAGVDRLPADITAAGSRYLHALMDGVRRGQAGEDDSRGHSLASYPPARAQQDVLIAFATAYPDSVRRVLRRSGTAEQRALAAQILAYTPAKSAIIADLADAVRDPDVNVRNHAMRALAVMAVYAQSQPESDLRVPFAPFIDMLNSVEWTDRNKASFALAALTTARDPELLRLLRERARPALIEMARWDAPGHALPAAVILGRMAGLPEREIFETFQKNKEALLAAALK
ncbi:MAG: hypothetical protein ACT443_12505, partial [Gemmatimonadota bacterium]